MAQHSQLNISNYHRGNDQCRRILKHSIVCSKLARLYRPESHVSSPREEVSEVLSFREPKRLWLYCPKLGLL